MLLLEDTMTLHGEWQFTLTDARTREVVDVQTYRNLITTVGKQLTLDRLFGLGGTIALAGTGIGTSATAAAVGNTALTGQTYKAFDAAPVRTGTSVVAVTTFLSAEGNINVQEAGLLTAAAGVLFNRLAPIGPINKTTALELTVRTTITQS